MKRLASRELRLFLIAWMVYSVHFATNIVREHYPAFALVEHGTFRVDAYQGLHDDIFVHRDGHSVIGNQVFVSVLAAIPLLVFDPVLDAIERYSKAKLARAGPPAVEYRIDKPNRQIFWQLVTARGLDLRFGASAVVTSVFFMAPATAGFLVFFFRVLRRRGVSPTDSTVLTLLMGFGTPLLFRTSALNHNLFVMYAMFASFILLWRAADGDVSTRRLLLAGLFAGITLATDYIAVLILPLLYGYYLLARTRSASFASAFREGFLIVAGTLPPIGFLLYSQWAMYGNPFLPGQAWMPEQNVYVAEGMRGFTLPDPELFLMNLFDPSFGMYTWAPVLALALVPARWYETGSLVLPRLERRWLAVTVVALLLFASANQYSRLQYNSGFRYLVPLVPFLMLAIADHWKRIPAPARWGIVVLSIAHAWVLTVYRESVLQSWRMFFAEGPQLPWYRVLGLTGDPSNPWLGTWWVPTVILATTGLTAWAVWTYGARLEEAHDGR